MRFFSNDAKETNDGEPDRDEETAAVPQQRVGSPWSDAPTDSSETSDTTDGSTASDASDDGHDAHDLGGPKAEHDDQVDLPLDGQSTFDEPVNESTVTSPDAPVDEPTDAETTGTDADPAIRDEGDFDSPQAVDPVTDRPLDADKPADEPVDADKPLDTGTDAIDTDRDSPESDTAESDAVDTTDTGTDVDIPVAATPVDSESDSTTYASAASADDAATGHDDTLTEDPTPADTVDSTAVVAAVPVAVAAAESTPAESAPAEPTPVGDAKPGSVAEKGVESLFDDSDAQAFRDRWRDVQLRFVDSPKDATAEAAGLVDEAVDKLTAGLKAQKDTLLSDSDDTEKLRLELRGYREILNKVLAL
jgi:hypothetical protein